MNREWRIQISKRKNYSDLKKRIVDCLVAQGLKDVTESDVRLWKFSEAEERLRDACKQITNKTDEEDAKEMNGDSD